MICLTVLILKTVKGIRYRVQGLQWMKILSSNRLCPHSVHRFYIPAEW